MASMMIFMYFLTNNADLNHIKSKTVGDGQHGTARFASPKEIEKTYSFVPFKSKLWRIGKNLPKEQGIIVGCKGKKDHVVALVDSQDVHCLMIGAAGIGKTAFFLYPNIEFALASGMSFLCTDTKGDLFRNYAGIARKYYGYHVSVIDLRKPTQSDEFNMLGLVNQYMDTYLKNPDNLSAKAKAERYAKIIAKTIIFSDGEVNYGQNQFFYDAAEGLLTSIILILAEFGDKRERHIISVFKLVQDLMTPSATGQNRFKMLLNRLPEEHKARWFAGAALNSADQAMMSVLSTALGRLNAFLDSELEQILCFDTSINTEQFCNTKSAIFLVLPEEDPSKYFIVSLLIQQIYREILSIADETEGKLKNRVMFYLDELGSLPKIDSVELMFSAGRSRRLSIIAIIQAIAQLEKNYGKEGAEIIIDNCQDTIFSGFAPNSQTAEAMSKALGDKTILSGSISKGRNDPSQSLQMIQRPLLMSDELKTLPKGKFITMKTGVHPMITKFRLFTEWGIRFEESYRIEDKGNRKVAYVSAEQIEEAISAKYGQPENADLIEFLKLSKSFANKKPKIKLFYPQLGVKLCSMAGGGVQKIYMVFFREPSRRDRSGSDLFHLRDGFEIKMNFDRNVSCFIFVNALMHDDFFD